MDTILKVVKTIQAYLWNFPMLVILLGTHIYFTFRLGIIQKWIPMGIRKSFSKTEGETGNVSPYSALSTALAATIGTGNIIGISTAIALGGPGAIFWCWITGVFGIATCYAESFLSVKYRVRRKDGSFVGGPMYVLEKVLHQKWAAILFSIFAVLASFGIGSSVQAHSISAAVCGQTEISQHLIGMGTAMLAGIVILGGGKQIAKVCAFLVPIMSIFFLGGCFFIMGKNVAYLRETIQVIVGSAFTSKSLAGGMTGTLVMTAMRVGISKGLFTNEAGLGSVPMAAATARTVSPVQQGLVSMTGTFWDTVVMCAITGITIVSSMIRSPEKYIQVSQDRLCFVAFSQLPFQGERILSVALVLFAFATIIGWNYYGECAVVYLWGEGGIQNYRILYLFAVYLGAVMSLELAWGVSDLFNSLMAIPNIACIWCLQKIIAQDTHKFLRGK